MQSSKLVPLLTFLLLLLNGDMGPFFIQRQFFLFVPNNEGLEFAFKFSLLSNDPFLPLMSPQYQTKAGLPQLPMI